MNTVCGLITSFVREEDANAVTEYAIMLGLIVLAAVGAIGSVGSGVSGTFTGLDESVPASVPM